MLLNLKKSDLARPVYRIVSLERLVDLFETKENVLVSPSKWEDTFENFILKSKVMLSTGETLDYNMQNSVFGQCWTLHDASDAMWRIYSPNKDGVRMIFPQFNGPPGKGYDSPAGVVDEQESVPTIFEGIQA